MSMQNQPRVADFIARLWLLDLRRRSFIEVGGTSYPREIWGWIRQRIETDDITNDEVPVALSARQARTVKWKARAFVERGEALGDCTIS
jgi:hypothetical protein